jgi:hypothetical protein
MSGREQGQHSGPGIGLTGAISLDSTAERTPAEEQTPLLSREANQSPVNPILEGKLVMGDLLVTGDLVGFIPFVQSATPGATVGGGAGKIALPDAPPGTQPPAPAPTDTVGANYAVLGRTVVLGNVNAQLSGYSFGAMPGRKAIPLTKPAPSVYIAAAETDVPLSGIIAELKGTPFDEIVLRDVKLMSATQPNDITPVGLTLQATLTLGDVGRVSDTFHSAASGIFELKQADLKVAAFFGTDGSWASGLQPRQFTLRGTFENIDVNVFDLFHVTELGAYVKTFRRIRIGVSKDEWPLVFGFFGTLRFALPGSPSPLLFSFETSVGEEVLSLAGRAQGSWSSVFGIPNLSIDDMSIYGQIRTATRSLDVLQVSAALTLNKTTLDLRGLYTSSRFSTTF